MPRGPVWIVQVAGGSGSLHPHQAQLAGRAGWSPMQQVSRVRHHSRAVLRLRHALFDHEGMGRSDSASLARHLATLPAFSGCPLRDLQELTKRSYRSSVPARWPLIHQETPADACYVILDGTVSVSMKGVEVATLGAGAVVGEMALANHQLRNATVTSTTPVDLLHIDAGQFGRLVETRPTLRAALLARTATMAG
jgi:CRP/FNR family cyclic AMP-dependent transcriptional regulator